MIMTARAGMFAGGYPPLVRSLFVQLLLYLSWCSCELASSCPNKRLLQPALRPPSSCLPDPYGQLRVLRGGYGLEDEDGPEPEDPKEVERMAAVAEDLQCLADEETIRKIQEKGERMRWEGMSEIEQM
mmetsp:Transcript_37162/g.58087  ORF Transcript_37162/g.58087 Transcript_37162/m.58087 type:complete len:128 (-) Transcript_37162:199-582(-)